METKTLKKEYIISLKESEIVFELSNINVLEFIGTFSALIERELNQIIIFYKNLKIKLTFNSLLDKGSTYKINKYIYELEFSINSLKYMLKFMLKLYIQGFVNVNHIHIYFNNDRLPEFTLTILIKDSGLVYWDDEVLE